MAKARPAQRRAVAAPSLDRGVRPPLIVVDNFLPATLAEAMRLDIDRHFAEPGQHRPESHQVWNYWFVPELYTYLRTTPEKIVRRDRVIAFFETLRRWSIGSLGLAGVTWPYLSLYVDGCRQGFHTDARNGRFGFVYSLTREERRTIGGETLVMRERDPFRGNLTRPAAGSTFYETVEPRFNRLLVFDDRLPHSVSPVEGSMDPVEGRFVLHGHLSEAGTVVDGALPPDAAIGPIAGLLGDFAEEAAARVALYHGILALRLTIGANGRVANCVILIDRVMHADAGDVDWEVLRQELIDRFNRLTFPATTGDTVVIQPIVFGEAMPTAGRSATSAA
jgi:hypothetical protein